MGSPEKYIPSNLVVAVVGPTAVGKTEVGLSLAKQMNAENAENAEIISCDSMQVYRDINVMTSKPSLKQRDEVTHHLIDILGIDEAYSAAVFKAQAEELIKQIHQRSKVPLIVGGTGLYLKALIDGIFPDKGADWEIRKMLYKEAGEYGRERVYKKLKAIDPETASALHPRDLRRVVRALEVYEVNGIPMSKLKEKTEGIGKSYQVKVFGLMRERSNLYRRINQRVDKMFEDGLVDEVKGLTQQKISRCVSQVLGYKEIKGFLDNQYDLIEAGRLLKRNTRHFAKRQMSWLRGDKRIIWIEVNDWQTSREIAKQISERI